MIAHLTYDVNTRAFPVKWTEPVSSEVRITNAAFVPIGEVKTFIAENSFGQASNRLLQKKKAVWVNAELETSSEQIDIEIDA